MTLPLWLAASILRPAALHVGADGMRLKSKIEDRFIPWSEFESAEPYVDGVVVNRRNGAPPLRIPVTVSRAKYGWEKDAIAALVERIRQALSLHRGGKPASAEAWLVRRGRPMAEWRRALFSNQESAFRDAAMRDEDLWSVLEDPSAQATARAAAAAMLTSGGDEQARARIRVAADACAEKRLRVALDRAATGAEEEELAQALEEIEDEEPRAR